LLLISVVFHTILVMASLSAQLTPSTSQSLLSFSSKTAESQGSAVSVAKSQEKSLFLSVPGVPRNVYETVIPTEQQVSNILDLFCCTKSLGQGSQGSVHAVQFKSHTDTKSQSIFALKLIPISQDADKNLKSLREMGMMQSVQVLPNTLKLFNVYMDSTHFGLLMEAGISLFTLVESRGHLQEDECRWIMFELLQELAHLHDNHIAHRDIKMDNVLLCTDASQRLVPKFIDYGEAVQIGDTDLTYDFVGTLCYLAPERVKPYSGAQARASDIWALGVTCYEMLTGKRCFFGKDDQEVLKKIEKATWHWPPMMEQNQVLSVRARHFVQSALHQAVSKRATARQLLKHAWLRDLHLP